MTGSGTILVTGASGFAGGHLVDRLAGRAVPVVGWCRPEDDRPPPAPGLEWDAVDVLDRIGVTRAIAARRPAVIYHCAGAAHAGASWGLAAATLRLNVMGTHHLLEAVRAAGVPARILIPGSALVYAPSDVALTEEAPLGPASPYATSKLAQEQLGAHVARARAGAVLLTRSFNHIGPRQAPSFAASSFARQVARIEAGLDAPVIRVGNLEARRDLTDVRDVVAAYVAIVERGTPGRLYNVCAGRAYPMSEILDRLVALARLDVTIRRDPARMRPSDVPLVLGDAGRLRDELDWAPAIPIDRTLEDLLDYWRSQVRPS